MLEAEKSRWFEILFAIYNRNLLKRRFHSLKISGLNFFDSIEPEIPLIIYANHSSWWDGLVFLEILRRFDFENYVMMEEKQLKKLFLFRRLGAFSVVRENPRAAVRSINYAVELLKGSDNRLLLIFPQGEILPNDARPIRFYQGLSRIIEKTGQVYAIPAALRFEFLGNFKPEIFVKIGNPEIVDSDKNFDSKTLTADFEKRLTETLDNLKREIVWQQTEDYLKLF